MFLKSLIAVGAELKVPITIGGFSVTASLMAAVQIVTGITALLGAIAGLIGGILTVILAWKKLKAMKE